MSTTTICCACRGAHVHVVLPFGIGEFHLWAPRPLSLGWRMDLHSLLTFIACGSVLLRVAAFFALLCLVGAAGVFAISVRRMF